MQFSAILFRCGTREWLAVAILPPLNCQKPLNLIENSRFFNIGPPKIYFLVPPMIS